MISGKGHYQAWDEKDESDTLFLFLLLFCLSSRRRMGRNEKYPLPIFSLSIMYFLNIPLVLSCRAFALGIFFSLPFSMSLGGAEFEYVWCVGGGIRVFSSGSGERGGICIYSVRVETCGNMNGM